MLTLWSGTLGYGRTLKLLNVFNAFTLGLSLKRFGISYVLYGNQLAHLQLLSLLSSEYCRVLNDLLMWLKVVIRVVDLPWDALLNENM